VSAPRSGESGNRFWRILFVILSLEIGGFLAFVPWAPVWEQRLIVGYLAPVRPVLLNYYVRGALSGLGLVNIWLGITQARAMRREAPGEPAE